MADQEETQSAVTLISPAMSIAQYTEHKQQIMHLIKDAMEVGKDYGTIPGTEKKTLYQPGAEKLANYFNLAPNFELVKEVEDWDAGFFFYKYRCILSHIGSGKFVGNSERSCNSNEKKYAFSSVAEKWANEDQKAKSVRKETRQKNGYTNTYLIIPKSPEEKCDQANTILAMAQKRALVSAVKTATMATDIFDDDIPETNGGKDGKVTADEDPARIAKLGHMFGVAGDRGFSADAVKKAIKEKFKLTSTTEATNEQIDELTEFLETNYQLVETGQKPIKIVTEVTDAVVVDVSETPEVETKPEETDSVGEGNGNDKNVEKECAHCHNKYTLDDPARDPKIPEGFDTMECCDTYWKEAKERVKARKG